MDTPLHKLYSLVAPGSRQRLESLRPRLYRLAYAWCHDSHLAEDLTQEAMTKAVVRGQQLRDEKALEAWLFSILNNCWRDHLRSRRDFANVDDLDEAVFAHDATPEHLYAQQQATARVRRALARLPIGQQQVLTLVDLEECAYAEVAHILGLPVGTVMSRLSRARQALKQYLLADEAGERPALRRVK